MRNITGIPARGEDFFKRDILVDRLWEMLESGENILIAAPRRVGKTSLIRYMEDNPLKGYSFLYANTESVNDENEFYRRVLNKLLKTEQIKKSQKAITFLRKRKSSVKKIGKDGIEFGVTEGHNYFEMLREVLRSIDEDKLVVMLDEFPQTLENIIINGSERSGIKFLHGNRELRQDDDIIGSVQFVYTGSIGLENIVGRLNASKTINDLARLEVLPLKPDESRKMINSILQSKSYSLSDRVIDYILEKIEWLIPFYIQLIIREIGNLYQDRDLRKVKRTTVDLAMERMLQHRNHFEHWEQRLRSSYNTGEYNFCKAVLNLASENETVGAHEIYDLAVKYSLEGLYRNLIDSLVYDGYINETEDKKIYRFNSPILREWWNKNVAN